MQDTTMLGIPVDMFGSVEQELQKRPWPIRHDADYVQSIMNIPHHNQKACEALLEYETLSQNRDEAMYEQIIHEATGQKINGRRLNTPALRRIDMQAIANKYDTTIPEMKQHWKCVEYIIKQKENE